MRVAVVTSSPPFAEGGHVVIARALVRALGEHGHAAELMLTPQNRFGRQGAAYLATWLTDVGVTAGGERVDHVISSRYPSYAVRHERHVCWLNHRMREYYDLWPRFSRSISVRARVKERVRRWLIHRADRYLLTGHVRKLFAQSRTVQERLHRHGHIVSEVLYPPAPLKSYRCDEYGDYVFAVSRLTPLKRFELLIRALAESACRGVRCVIAGDGEEAGRLRTLVADLNLNGRVQLIGAIGSDDLVRHLARCRAVCFPPYEEDYGLVTVEAFAAAKSVITCTDSGGPAELVRTGETGIVCDPTPEAIAAGIARVFDDRTLAIRMGEAAKQIESRLTWSATIEELLLMPK